MEAILITTSSKMIINIKEGVDKKLISKGNHWLNLILQEGNIGVRMKQGINIEVYNSINHSTKILKALNTKRVIRIHKCLRMTFHS